MKSIFIAVALILTSTLCYAGNPDRQGEAGAYELLLLPWARTAGLNGLNTSIVSGLESIRLNPAGLSRIEGREVIISHTRLFDGTDININALGFATKAGKDAGFGVTLEALDFGEIDITTTNNPEGTGGVFRPLFINLALSYSKNFEEKIYIGVTGRAVAQSLADVSAFGFSLDAGVQYVTGEQDNFKFGVVLRNFGTPMTYSGQGLSIRQDVPVFGGEQNTALDLQANKFELPSQLNIGVSYDLYGGSLHRVSMMGSFIANSFSLDQLGAGVEYAFKEQFMLRAGYKEDLGDPNIPGFTSVYTGLSMGASIMVPTNRDKTSYFGIDYAYRTTNPFNGTHNIGIRFDLN